jgi:hypothetical protein
VLAGDGTRFLGLRSCGPIAVSTSIISRFGMRLGGSSAGGAVASTAIGSVAPFDHLDRAASLRFKGGLDELDHGFKLLVRQILDWIAVLNLVLARDQQSDNFQPQSRLVAAYLRNRLLPVLAEIA